MFILPKNTFPANWDEVYASWEVGEITAKIAMERTGKEEKDQISTI